MNLYLSACFVYAALSASISSPSSGTMVPPTDELKPFQIAKALRGAVADNGGCQINACFAFQASRFILRADYETQKTVVDIVSRVIGSDPAAQIAAVQYAAANSEISPLSSDVHQFIVELKAARQSSKNESFIGGAIIYCADQIRTSPDDVNKMVLLGDGQNTIGFEPLPRAEVFRELGGEVFVVGIGCNMNLGNLEEVVNGSDSNLILIEKGMQEQNNYLANVVVQLVSGLCGISNDTLKASLGNKFVANDRFM